MSSFEPREFDNTYEGRAAKPRGVRTKDQAERERDKKRIALFSSLRPNLSSFILLIYMILLFQ